VSDDVIIVGAGPAGLTLACELRLAGVSTVVLERLPGLKTQSWGTAINSATVELLDQRGLMEPLSEDGFSWPLAYFSNLKLDPMRQTEQHSFSFIVSQANLERRLEQRARDLGAELRYGHEVTALRQDTDGVSVTVRTDAGTSTVEGRFLVGCDGGGSTVRELAGIDFPGTDAPFHGLVGDLEFKPDTELLQHVGAHQCATGLFLLAQVGENVLRIATGEFDRDSPGPQPAALEELQASAERLMGLNLGDVVPRWLARWDNRARQAARYRQGAVFLAGEAAHVHFPLGGLSLNGAVEDAANLAWKLAAELAGWAPAGLLDTYEAERQPVADRAISVASAQVALMYPLERVAPLRALFTELIQVDAVNEVLVRMVAGLDVRYALSGADAHPLIGRRLPPFELASADGPATPAEALRTGRGVLLELGGDAPDVSGWSGRLSVVRAEPVNTVDADLVLLRPDGRVAWARRRGGTGTDGLHQALSAWFGAPDPAA
jgi:2-polyprenyl-6-methoxyphenol hydroxylase-like FAD-dependent oxidoreductase